MQIVSGFSCLKSFRTWKIVDINKYFWPTHKSWHLTRFETFLLEKQTEQKLPKRNCFSASVGLNMVAAHQRLIEELGWANYILDGAKGYFNTFHFQILIHIVYFVP